MPAYGYRAYTAQGQVASGIVDATNTVDAVQKLSLQGLLPFEAPLPQAETAVVEGRVRRQLPPTELALLLRSVHTLLEAGVTIDAALRLATLQPGNENRRTVLARLHEDVVAGKALSEAMAVQEAEFTRMHIALVRAGEQTGHLQAAIRDLSQDLEREAELRARISAALIYPGILLVAAIAAMALVFVIMVPSITPLFEGQSKPLPLVLAAARSVGGFLQGQWMTILAMVAAAAAGLSYLARSGRLRRLSQALALRTPGVRGMVHDAAAARFARSFGILLQAGTTLPRALAIAADAIPNETLRDSLHRGVEALKRGAGLDEALSGFAALPVVSRGLISIGAESNHLPEMLLRVAEMHEAGLKDRIEKLMTVLTPALTIGIGLVVGGLVLSVMNAILSANDLAF